MTPRICTSCLLPHLTTDWYRIESYHPCAGQFECVSAHERRIAREVRDFGEGRVPKPISKPFQRKPDLAELLGIA